MKLTFLGVTILIIVVTSNISFLLEESTLVASEEQREIFFDASRGYYVDAQGAVGPERLAAWIIEENPNPQELLPLLEFPLEERLAVIEAGALRLDVPKENVEQAIRDLRRGSLKTEIGEDDFDLLGSCTQNIEYDWWWPQGSTSCSYYWSDRYCDNNGGDNEYVFRFYPSWGDNSDDVRWWTFSSWVWYVFMGSYGGNLLGSDACTSGISLCIGDTGVWAAGGPWYVSINLLVSHD